ncbi:MAG: hypothetical protein EOO38_17770 [Cytophagaceae bacterium]|nr:MAG: hypothetical protein EOO38_17770 [Cytophagaceae bacterium]
MHARKVASALVGVLFVALCITTVLLSRQKAALITEARREIQTLYNSPLYAPGSTGSPLIPIPRKAWDNSTNDYVDSRTIQQFSVQGERATVVVKHHQSTSTNSREQSTQSVTEVTAMNRDEWRKVAGQWVSVQSQRLSSDTIMNGKQFHFAY